ncbi:carotenoid oxygenase family protein [Streptomyces sp. CA-288835]|uniref:carotenoid oxygenase family protein n=1 Tax=Streptomyces sp. CA-288835 TaxID=3240069 RepID=UPI003D8D0506
MKPYLTGHYTPHVDEVTAHDLRVEGTLPPELSGRLVRNGHNPKPGITPTHWFKGSGMVHGIRLRHGRAEWYRNRWVRTPALDGAPYMTDKGPDLTASTAGTHVIEHAGRLLALCESNFPFELTPDLETVGAYDFDGRLTDVMTAHPKHDPGTGELHFFSSSPFPPYLTYHVSSDKGELLHSEEVPGASASLKHDFAVTERYVVFMEGTVTFDHGETSGIPYAWKDEQPARIGVMPRGRGGAASIKWFGIEPGSMLHAANAYEDGPGRIVLEGPTVDRDGFQRSWNWWVGSPGRGAVPNSRSFNRQWVIDLPADTVREQTIDDLVIEFPTINENLAGRRHRYQYAISFPDDHGIGNFGVVKYDRTTGARLIRNVGDGQLPSEAVFVPSAQGTSEDDGYLLTVISNLHADASQLLVLDATDVTAAPVATVHLPRRVTAGIHGSWIDDQH